MKRSGMYYYTFRGSWMLCGKRHISAYTIYLFKCIYVHFHLKRLLLNNYVGYILIAPFCTRHRIPTRKRTPLLW